MAARSARTSSSEEASRSTDDEERMLTKRSIEWHRANSWETLFEGEKAEKKKQNFHDPDSDPIVFPGNTPVAHTPR